MAIEHAPGGSVAPVGHHFNNLKQQQATVRFGMWLFMVTEVLFFGGAFCAYTAYRIWFPREFEAGSAALNVGIATVNTFLLLTSSLFITLGIRAAYLGDQGKLRFWLLLTILFGAGFLGLKMREYYLDYEEGLIPGRRASVAETDATHTGHQRVDNGPTHNASNPGNAAFVNSLRAALEKEHYNYDGVNLERVQLFFMLYYSMTGLHVLHMVVGIGLLTWQVVLVSRGFFRFRERYVYVEVMSLYWHFVDMVWMFLFPLLYLAGPHTLGQAVEQFKLAIGMAGGH